MFTSISVTQHNINNTQVYRQMHLDVHVIKVHQYSYMHKYVQYPHVHSQVYKYSKYNYIYNIYAYVAS